jgi:DNA helicase-2/ATP-dependent DNA helicase PcrA
MSFGRTEFARPSRFLEDVPSDLWREIDALGQPLAAIGGPRRPTRSTWTAPVQPGAPRPAGTSTAGSGSAPANGGPIAFRGGERVKHPKFGPGTVVGLSGEGTKAEVTVVFEAAGAKRLLVKFANLERA